MRLEEEVLEFLKHSNEYFPLVKKEWKKARGVSPKEVRKIVKGEEFYFIPNGVTFREEEGKVVAERRKEDIVFAQFFFLDFDVFEREEVLRASREEMLKRARKLFEKVKERCKKENLKVPHLCLYTGKGIHVYWRVKPFEDLEKWEKTQRELIKRFRDLGADPSITNANRIMRVPFSRNPKVQKDVEVIDFSPGEISHEEFEFLLPEEKPRMLKIGGTELSEEAEDAICKKLLPYYKKGNRHNLVYYLTAFLVKKGVSSASIYEIFKKLARNDEEKERRAVQAVEHQLKKIEEGKIKSEELKAKSGLVEVLEKVLKEMGEKNAGKKAYAIVSSIERIITKDREKEEKVLKTPYGELDIIISEGKTYAKISFFENEKFCQRYLPVAQGTVNVIAVEGNLPTVSPQDEVTLSVTKHGKTYIAKVKAKDLETWIKINLPTLHPEILMSYVSKQIESIKSLKERD